jgi:AcrR family transcriptional regulator
MRTDVPPSNAPKPETSMAAKAAQTRARLMETALDLLGTREFRQMSLDAIAARAGVTKGAIYGHFKSKDDLLHAALFSQPEARPEQLAWPEGRKGTVKQRLRRLGEAVLTQRRESGRSAAIGAEFIVYALSDDRMRGAVGDRLNQTQADMEKRVLGLFAPEELPMPVESFALMLSALLPGLMFIRAFRGARMTDEQVLAMFEGLAG